jgi:multimeric flavodoxin WrbA
MRKISKPKQFFLYAGPFPSLIFFQVWATADRTPESLLISSLSMLAYCALILVIASRWDQPGYFDWAIAGYFMVICGFLLLWPDGAARFLAHYAATGVYVCLFGAACFPPLLGMDPFTYHYAKKSAPPESWGHPIFVKINLIMTFVWAGIFGVGIALSLYPSIIMKTIIPNGIILFFGFPFNSRFPNYYLKRLGLPSPAEQRGMEQPLAIKQTTIDPEQKLTFRKENTMQVLALNSSPRGEGQSKTGLMLDRLVLGMREAGAEVEVVDLREKRIRNCSGCFTCWTKTPGVCIHKDDMSSELFPKFIKSDLVIYATPLYHFTVNATMKAFIERTLPILQPFFEESGEATKHPLRHEFPKVVFLSVAGFPEMSAFDQLSSWVRFIFGRSKTLVAEIYRPAAEAMTVPFYKDRVQQILEATRKAGQEIVQSMKISEETLVRVTQDFVGDKEAFRKMGNLFWKSCIAEGVTPKEFAERGLIPRPDSIETFMMLLPMGFNPDGSGDTKAVLQFNFTGEVEGSCHFRIENRRIKSILGPAEKPDITIDSPFEVWMDIMTGKADGQQMFMAQKYKVTGDFSLLMRMNQIFGKQG